MKDTAKNADTKTFFKKYGALLVFAIYTTLLVFIMYVHEPWFDEAESWLIARDNSFHDMIFVSPHYEGHPPLWWLLLAVPAKLGAPYEIGLKSVQIVFTLIYTYLILFKSKFPTIIRYLLPFTYFLFFQHGVMARPYSMMTVAVILTAITWEERNEKPARFCATLGFLCLTSAYGILIAGGIAIVWVFELLQSKTLFKRSIRLISLTGLLALALFLIFTMFPKPDTYATTAFEPITVPVFLKTLLFFFLFVPSETAFTSYGADGALRSFSPDLSDIVVMSIVSVCIWMLAIRVGKKKHTFFYLIVPYAFVAIFGSAEYFSFHHIGVIFLLLLYFAWITSDPDSEVSISDFKTSSLLKKAIYGFAALSFICSLSWTLTCCITDIRMPYALGRKLSKYILENGLEDKNWLTSWQQIRDEETQELISENTHQFQQVAVETNAYFDHNLFGDKLGGKTYLDHRVPTQEEIKRDYQLIRAQRVDYIIGMIDKETLDQLGLGTGFRMDTIIEIDRIWKTHHLIADIFIIKNTES